jgi:hypothetical protein
VFGGGQRCPVEYTNVLSNANLFTLEQQRTIKEAFAKYKNVTTNSGPPGTVLDSLFKTNVVINAMYRTGAVETWVAAFRYTNSDAHEEIRFGAGMLANFRNQSNDGYYVEFNQSSGGTMLGFGQVNHGLTSGILARFVDLHDNGLVWDYRLADFSNSRLAEYRQYTNGMVLGRYLVWDVRSGNLLIEAQFNEPYDWRKHYHQMHGP